jgi:solute carrier family 25 (peroxisomal adenine nucleotide transporter), member 17
LTETGEPVFFLNYTPANMSESFAEAVSGAAGGAFSSFMVYPLEIIKTKLQVQSDSREKKTMSKVVSEIISADGYLGFFNGVELGATQSAIQKFVYFYIYGALLRMYQERISPTIGFWANVGIGYVSDLAHQPITLPIETIGVRVQTNTTNQSTFDIVRESLSDGSCYNGLSAYFFLCLSPALRSAVYDRLKGVYISRMRVKEISGLTGLLLGMIARTIASTLMYPAIRGRVILQGQKDNAGLFGSLSKIVHEQGILSLFKGLDAELLRGIYMAKESIEGSVKRAIVNRD